MKIMGIDPGLSGALASYDAMHGLCVLQIPILRAATRGNDVNWAELVGSLDVLFPDIDHAFIERVGARPGQGTASMFKFGYVAGGLRGVVAARQIPVTMVTPGKWKKTFGLGTSKDASRARACELFPKEAHLFARKKDEGVAEAALIALYGYRKMEERV